MEQSTDPQSLLEWFTEKYKEFGANLEVHLMIYFWSGRWLTTSSQFVSNRSPEGAQFVKGFGGIGGILRYKVDFSVLAGADDDDDEFYSDSDDGI